MRFRRESATVISKTFADSAANSSDPTLRSCFMAKADSLADSEGMTIPRTGSSSSGETDLEKETGKLATDKLSSEKSKVPPNSTCSNGGNCFPKRQRRRWQSEKEGPPLWNTLPEILAEVLEAGSLHEVEKPPQVQECER